MTAEYWLTHMKLNMRATLESELRSRPYELIAQQSDGVLAHFAAGHRMQPLRKD